MNPDSFKYYAESNMPVAAYASQAKGFFSKMAALGEDGLSQKSKDRYLCNENLKTLEIIKELSAEYNCSIAAVVCGALASLSSPEVFPIVGPSRASQLEDSMKGADIVFDRDVLSRIFCDYNI
jgi:aryl-alcohol dehydrogenase-like predicted oxidoreductase